MKIKLIKFIHTYGTTILFITIAAIFYFGIRVSGYGIINKLDNNTINGLLFKRNSMAFSEKMHCPFALEGPPFSLIIVFQSDKESFTSRFQSIVMFHDGSDNDQLMIGQWKRWIIVMNGCDYSNKQKIPRISFKIAPSHHEPIFLAVVSNENGTSLYVNGKLHSRNKRLKLSFPDLKTARLILGNNVYANAPWSGTLYGLCLLGYSLSETDVKKAYNKWRKNDSFIYMAEFSPILLFDFFKLSQSRQIKGVGSCSTSLKIPYFIRVLKKKMLFPSIGTSSIETGDIIKNFIGFIPLGFVSFAYFFISLNLNTIKSISYALFLSIFCSLTIEVLQMWLPSRCSDITDILFNSLGGLLGILIGRLFFCANSVILSTDCRTKK